MKDSTQIPAIAEPWFLAFIAKVTLKPVMNANDLENGMPGFKQAVEKFANNT